MHRAPPPSPGKLLTLGAKSRAREGNYQKAQETVNILPLTDSAATFRVVGDVNGSPVSFLLDTGAAVTLIRRDVWDSLGLAALKSCHGPRLVGVDGNTLPVQGSAQIQLMLGGERFLARAIIADSLTTGAILGLDFLQEHSCIIDVRDRKLHLSNLGVSVPLLGADDHDTHDCIDVHLVETIQVPAYSEMEVMGKPQVPVFGTWLVERHRSQRIPVMVANAVVSPGSAGIPVRLLNPTDQAVMIHKGKIIATMEAVTVGATRDLEVATVEKRDQDQLTLSREQQELLQGIVDRCGTQLTTTEQEQLHLLLTSYTDIFATNPMDLGRTSRLQHSIHTGETQPIRQRLRRLPLYRRGEVQQLLKDILSSAGVSPSPLSSTAS